MSDFFSKMFGGSNASGFVGLITTVVGGLLGFLFGGPVGAAVGAGTGLLGTAAFGDALTKGIQNAIGIETKSRPEEIIPVIEDVSSKTVAISNEGKKYDLALPQISKLKQLSIPADKDNIEAVNKETFKLVTDPYQNGDSLEVLKTTVKDRNQAYYNYIATVERFATQNAPASFPRVNFQLPATLERTAKVVLKTGDNEWKALPAAEKLAKIEEATNNQLIELSKRNADLRKKAEELGSKWSLNLKASYANPMNWTVTDWLVPGSLPVNMVLSGFSENPSQRNGREAVQRFLQNGNEETFKKEMEELAKMHSHDWRDGAEKAQLVRDQATALIESRKLLKRREELLGVKKEWTMQATQWIDRVEVYANKLNEAHQLATPTPTTITNSADRSNLGSMPTPNVPAKPPADSKYHSASAQPGVAG